ncbi:MAG: glycosyltransferase family 1 protein [Desulfobacula sp.]|jgi:glycosyltransferase involved in cell wall biosynthesis|nr:glycosyltransferase family 1 protein [Desulfobacula sp.]
MRIGLNLLHMHDGIGGVWNYVENLISALGDLDKQNTYIVFVTRQSQCLVPEQENFQKILININPKKAWHRILYENTILHYYVLKHKIDCFHWFANMVSPFLLVPGLVTIYDLLPLRNPGSYSKIKHLYLKIVLNITARKAKSILPISNTTALDIIQILKPKTDKLHVLPVIINESFKPSQGVEIKEFKNKYQLPEKFWLYVANFYPHKNHIRLINAYSDLKKQGQNPWPLVLRGDSGTDTGITKELIKAEIKKLNLDKDVIWLPRLAYHELPLLYSGASALIFPSLFEGCGIPVIEAMACGCPVAVSDIEVVREFAGEAAFFFNGKNINDICDAMAKIQIDQNLRGKLIKQGITRSRFFSGKQVIEKLLMAYKGAVS